MVRKIFSVYDVKAEIFNQPFFMSTKGEALRAFSDLANDSQSSIAKHPGDYKLVYIGMFDDVSGEVDEVERESLGFASDFVERKVS